MHFDEKSLLKWLPITHFCMYVDLQIDSNDEFNFLHFPSFVCRFLPN